MQMRIIRISRLGALARLLQGQISCQIAPYSEVGGNVLILGEATIFLPFLLLIMVNNTSREFKFRSFKRAQNIRDCGVSEAMFSNVSFQ